ncbi:MAG: O-methyltransferase [Candidatus Dadabacteria bacterium]|nr:O-methyltransferase [Candidatus Dadabacteria bacterium]
MNQFTTHITNPEIDKYLISLIPSNDEVLTEMERLGAERGFPIIGPLVGRLLYQLALIKGAKRVFELGSGFGYSTYWFAKALGEGGVVYYTDTSSEYADKAREFFKRGGLLDSVIINVGDAVSALQSSEGSFDIIFNDINKERYPEVIPKAYDKLNPGGLFITDNVLWRGRVLSSNPSPSTKGVKEFTRTLLAHDGFLTTIIPIRDGISLSIRL